MTTTTYLLRLFGGRDVGLTTDGSNLTIAGQSIAVSSLSSAQQAALTSAIALAPTGGSRPAFGGSTLMSVIGGILDAQPAWRNSIVAALASMDAANSGAASAETWNR